MRSDKRINILTAFLLGLSGVSLLLVPDRLGSISGRLEPIAVFCVGVAFYFISWANQAVIFILPSPRSDRIVRLVSAVGLTLLGYFHWQAHQWMVVAPVLTLAVIHVLFMFPLPVASKPFDRYFFSLGMGTMNLLVSSLILLTPADSTWYSQLVSWQYALGAFFAFGGFLGVIGFIQKERPVSKNLAKLVAVPWLIWSVLSLSLCQLDSLFIALSLGIIPWIARAAPWDTLSIPKDDILGHRILISIALVETVMLFSITATGTIARQVSLEKSLSSSALTFFNPDVAFLAMVAIKGIAFFGLALTALTINKLTTLMANIDSNSLKKENEAINRLSAWISQALKPLLPRALHPSFRQEMQAEKISSLIQQLDLEKKRVAQYNLLLEMSHQLEAQFDLPIAAQITVNMLQRALDCLQVTIYEHDLKKNQFLVIATTGNILPPGYHQQTTEGILGRTLRQRKTQIVSNSRQPLKKLQ